MEKSDGCGAKRFVDGDFVRRVDGRSDGHYGGDSDVEDQSECAADPDIAVCGERLDGEGCVCGRREKRGTGIGVSLPDCVHSGDGFLLGKPEDRIFVEQCMGGGRAIRSFGLRIHVLGGDAAFECEARCVFVGSGDYGGDYAHCLCGIADCIECEELFEVGSFLAQVTEGKSPPAASRYSGHREKNKNRSKEESQEKDLGGNRPARD